MSEFIFYNGSRVKNIAGNVYGDMKAVEVVGIKDRYALWKFECVKCGEPQEISAKRINKDKRFKCKKCNTPKPKNPKPTGRITIKPEDVIGKDFGFWHVEGLAEQKSKNGGRLYTCRCKCGTIRNITAATLVSGRSKSCGCSIKVDISGKKFGLLKAIEPVGSDKGVLWRCECKCGNFINATCSELQNGSIGSCGCAGKIEKEQHTKIVWAANGGQKLRANNTSGVRGVNKGNGKWVARITFKHQTYCLGTYDTLEEAAEARRTAEKKLYGDFLKWYYETYPESQEKSKNIKEKRKKNIIDYTKYKDFDLSILKENHRNILQDKINGMEGAEICKKYNLTPQHLANSLSTSRRRLEGLDLKYYYDHKEQINARRDREKSNARQREYYKNNKEYLLEKGKKYREEHKEEIREKAKKRYAEKRAAQGLTVRTEPVNHEEYMHNYYINVIKPKREQARKNRKENTKDN